MERIHRRATARRLTTNADINGRPAAPIPDYPDLFALLTGGGGRRLGGVDKASIDVAGQSLLAHATSLAAGRPVIVVGPDPQTAAATYVTREDPPGGGPAAGIAAAVALATTLCDLRGGSDTVIAIQAVDQLGVTAGTWRRLVAALRRQGGPGYGGAVLTDGGRRQYGVGVYGLRALAAACRARETWQGQSLRAMLDPLVTADVPALGDEARDVDTLEDLTWWRARGASAATDESADEGT